MPRKPAGTAVDPRNGARYSLEGVPEKKLELPDVVRKSLRNEALLRWQEFVTSPVAKVLDPADYLIAIRWIEAVNRSIICTREADEEPILSGSSGNSIMNPLYRVAAEQTKIAQDCEKQLGIGPKNRADLGVTLIAGKPSLEQMNREFSVIENEPDPRTMEG